MYTTEKVGKHHVNIYRDGVYQCQLYRHEVNAWLFRAERSDANDREHAIAQRAYRIEAAIAYLARRLSRAASWKQLELI